jgi:hypothetical protein
MSNATFCSACFDSRFEEGADFFPDYRGNPVKRNQYKRIARNTLFEAVYNTIQSEKGERGYFKDNCNYRFPTLDSGECDPWQNNIATIPRDALRADDIAFVVAHVLAQEDCNVNHLDLAGVCYNNDGFGHIGFKAIAMALGVNTSLETLLFVHDDHLEYIDELACSVHADKSSGLFLKSLQCNTESSLQNMSLPPDALGEEAAEVLTRNIEGLHLQDMPYEYVKNTCVCALCVEKERSDYDNDSDCSY